MTTRVHFFVTYNNSVTACIHFSGKRLILPHHSGAYCGTVLVCHLQGNVHMGLYAKVIELAMNNLQHT